jgi:hypothetical protein
MSEPGGFLHALIEAERESDAPPAEVVERGWSRLDAALVGVTAVPDPMATATATAGTKVAVGKVMLAVVGASAVAVGGYFATRPDPPTPTPTVGVAEPEPESPSPIAPPLEVDAPVHPIEVPGPEAEPSPTPLPRSRPRPTTTDPFAAEVELMRRASAALSDGRPRDALRLVRRHAERFPEGQLIEERSATEAIARCQLGQPRAPGLARAFIARYPRSTHLDRVKRSCEGGL